MDDRETRDLLKRLVELSESQVTLLTDVKGKLDELILGIGTVADGLIS